MNNLSLAGIAVLVTRPSPAGDELCEWIRENEGHAYHLPTLAFVLQDKENSGAVLRALPQLDFLIFVSPHAVFYSAAMIRETPQCLNAEIAAIGAGTKKALLAADFSVAHCASADPRSEGLLALPAFQQVKGKNIGIVGGEGGRLWLAQELTKRGANVYPIIMYKRIVPEKPANAVFAQMKSQKPQVILAASFESIANLTTMVGTTWQELMSTPLIVPSLRVKKLARDLGFQTIWSANNASNTAMLAALLLRRSELWQMKKS